MMDIHTFSDPIFRLGFVHYVLARRKGERPAQIQTRFSELMRDLVTWSSRIVNHKRATRAGVRRGTVMNGSLEVLLISSRSSRPSSSWAICLWWLCPVGRSALSVSFPVPDFAFPACRADRSARRSRAWDLLVVYWPRSHP